MMVNQILMTSIVGESFLFSLLHLLHHNCTSYNSLIWSEEESDFLDLPRLCDVELVLASMPEQHKPCYSCGLKHREEARDELRRVSGGFSQYGVAYHVGDSVYIKPSTNDGLLKIAQITKIKGVPLHPEITVRYFGRYDDFVWEHKHKKAQSSLDLVSDEVRECIHGSLSGLTLYLAAVIPANQGLNNPQ